jgi:hypothetical protein
MHFGSRGRWKFTPRPAESRGRSVSERRASRGLRRLPAASQPGPQRLPDVWRRNRGMRGLMMHKGRAWDMRHICSRRALFPKTRVATSIGTLIADRASSHITRDQVRYRQHRAWSVTFLLKNHAFPDSQRFAVDPLSADKNVCLERQACVAIPSFENDYKVLSGHIRVGFDFVPPASLGAFCIQWSANRRGLHQTPHVPGEDRRR